MKIMYVCINVSATKIGERKGRENLYQCIRKYWELNGENLQKAKQTDYVAGVFNGFIVDMFRPQKWDIVKNFSDMKDDDEVKKNHKYLSFYAFEGDPTGKDIPKEVKKAYCNKPYSKKFSKEIVYHFDF